MNQTNNQDVPEWTFRKHFESMPWEEMSPSQAYGIYALGLYTGDTDFEGLATGALTDGPDDKKIDFCHIDEEAHEAYFGQAYVAQEWGRVAAPANKVSDLSSGATWLLREQLEKIPDRLRGPATELRDLIDDNGIDRLTVLYVHNCNESDNVRKELDAVAKTVKALLGNDNISVMTKELGGNSIQHLYHSLDREILVEDEVEFSVSDSYEHASDRWSAVMTVVRGDELRDLANKYGDDLYSANIRGYLKIYRRKGNVNQKIQNTVLSEPESFWAYNNGITILTNDYTLESGKLLLSGISIINGAQTTGVLGDSPEDEASRVKVNARFVKCGDEAVVKKIIQYNNTQNEIKSFDQRSNDTVQRQLKAAFDRYGVIYDHRRSGDAGKATGKIKAAVVAQALCSFRGDLQTSIRQRSLIFEDDKKYKQIFPQAITCEHVYLIQCLSDAVDQIKARLREKVRTGQATELAEQRAKLFDYQTAKQFLIAVVGQISQQLVGQSLPDPISWKCRSPIVKPDRSDMIDVWTDLVERLLPRIARAIGDSANKVLRSTEGLKNVAEEVQDHLEGAEEDYRAALTKLRDSTSY